MTRTRTRILASVVGLLTLSTIVSTLALRQILLARVDARVEAGLTQEVTEFRRFARDARDPRTGRPAAGDVARVFDLFLARDVPDAGQATFTFVGDRPYRSSADFDTSEALLTGVRRLAGARTVARGDLATPGGGYRYLAVPITSGGVRSGTFVVTADLAHERGEVAEAVRIATLISLAMLLIVSVLTYLMIGRILAPLGAVGSTARAIGSGDDLTRRIAVRGNDEIAELARTFNAMLDRLQAAFATQRDFISDAGHELRTPITIVRGHLELLGDEPVERAESLAVITDELDRMSRFVEDLLALAKSERPDFLQPAELDLDLLTEELLHKAERLGPRDWRIERTGVGLLTADRQRLTQAVMNLASNAVQHTRTGGRIELGSELRGDQARIWVADDGPGVAAGDRERIFDRFTRGGAAERRPGGAGLGLAIVRTIAQAHGGDVELDDRAGGGARFTIVIPAGRTARPAPDDEAEREALRT